jgi:phage terminase small subunit
MANKAFVQMLRMLAEFGMTPSSRTRIASGLPADNPNDLEMFLNGD